ncbi:MAG TPA: hypothetical protein VF189_06210 [Patescibacteria group bacterium]
MKCPRCQQNMKFIETHTTFRDDGKEYNHGVYNCELDDIWVTIEVPVDTRKNLA